MDELCVEVEKELAPSFSLKARFQTSARVTALFGRSGSGKTTLLLTLAGLIRPDCGKITWQGKVIFDSQHGVNLPTRRRHIGVVFQEASLFPHLRVVDNLKFGLRSSQSKGSEFRETVDALGLNDLLERFSRDLSGGEKQRVALGRAILAHPSLLLLDEPVAALDAPSRDKINQYLRHLTESKSIPLIYVTHYQAELRHFAEHVVLLEGGQVAASGPLEQVLADPKLLTQKGAEAPINILMLDQLERQGDKVIGSIAAGEILLPDLPGPGQTTVRLAFSPASVTLARHSADGVSIRNQLPGVVSQVIKLSDRWLVAVDIGSRIWAEITPSAGENLQLDVGSRVLVLIKTRSMTLL